jgi:hypothetical protein
MLSIGQLRTIGRAVPGIFEILDTILLAQLLFMGFVIVATAAVCIRNYRNLTDAGQRRRIRWVFAGMVVAAVPMIITTACWVVWAAMGIVNQMQPALAVLSGISNLLIAAVPISIAYAVLKHRVMGIQVVVRRGIQYLLAANALRLLVALPVIGLVWGIVENPNRTVPQLLFEGGTALPLGPSRCDRPKVLPRELQPGAHPRRARLHHDAGGLSALVVLGRDQRTRGCPSPGARASLHLREA